MHAAGVRHVFGHPGGEVVDLIEDFSMVSYLKLDCTDEDSVGAILSYIDDCIQYHEAQEPKELAEEEFEEAK